MQEYAVIIAGMAVAPFAFLGTTNAFAYVFARRDIRNEVPEHLIRHDYSQDKSFDRIVGGAMFGLGEKMALKER